MRWADSRCGICSPPLPLEWTRCLGCQLYGAVFAIISSRSQLADWRIASMQRIGIVPQQ